MSPLEKVCLQCNYKVKGHIENNCPFYIRFKDYFFKCPKCGMEIPIFWLDTAYYHQLKCRVSLKILRKYKVLEEKVVVKG